MPPLRELAPHPSVSPSSTATFTLRCGDRGREKRPRLRPGLRPSVLWVGGNLAKQAVGVVVRTGGKEQLVGLAAVATVAELDGPDLVDDNRLVICIAQRAEERAGNGIEGVDPAVGNVVGNQQSVTELAEISRSHRQTPQRMERTGDALKNSPGGGKFDHEAGWRLVATEGYPEVAAHGLKSGRSKAGRSLTVCEGTNQFEVIF